MARRKSGQVENPLFEARLRTAPCVAGIKDEVRKWADGSPRYKGVTQTTKQLMEFWFHTDHIHNGRKFDYYHCQKEAIETLVYIYEIAGAPMQKQLLETYAQKTDKEIRLLQFDDFPRYCIKMATGSGKTVVMSLLCAWQFFNAVLENKGKYASTFLILAPNVIVLERLKTDFMGGVCFKKYPVIPDGLKIYWGDFDCYIRGDSEKPYSPGALYLTNIQQFYERPNHKADNEPLALTDVMGTKPLADMHILSDFDERIIKRKSPVMVINDEAHHTHDEDLCWNEFIRGLSEKLASPLIGQIDFTATPRYQKGELFTWTVYDYPLKQAILDNIVKRPIKGITSGIAENPSEVASTKYQAYLVAAVERWKEYYEQHRRFNKKPVLFIMLNETKEADNIGDWLRRKYTDLFGGDKTLIIHTNLKGEVSKDDLDKVRMAARKVDDENSPVNAIVSVLMLREGWDVKNVCVILGLRPYRSKANILPEQTIGRGLRLMYPDSHGVNEERVDILGNDAFLQFVDALEREEEIALDTFRVGIDKLKLLYIEVDEKKLDKDINLVVLTPLLSRKKSIADEIFEMDVHQMALSEPFPTDLELERELKRFKYEGYDIITMEKLFEKEYEIPEVQCAEEVIAYYAECIAENVKLPSMFQVLAPKVHQFLSVVFFGETVNLNEEKYLIAIRHPAAFKIVVDRFTKALRPIVLEEHKPVLENEGIPISQTQAFPYTRPTFESDKCIFNLVPCANEFEKAFARFLHNAKDIVKFSSIPEQVGFHIVYTDSANNIRYYRPDFVAIDIKNRHYLIETKGREDIEDRHKYEFAERWCAATSELTGEEWYFVVVNQSDFETSQVHLFEDLSLIYRLSK